MFQCEVIGCLSLCLEMECQGDKKSGEGGEFKYDIF
jgi:hypothetical protein